MCSILSNNCSAGRCGVKKKKAVKFDLVKKMFDEIGPRYENRNGGYTRIIKLGKRKGDGADMALIELV